MLTPEQLDSIPDSFEAMFSELDEYIVKDFARRVSKAGKVTDTAEWIAIRAKEIGLAEEELQKEVARVMKLSDKEIKDLFGDVAFTSAEADRTRFESAGLNAERIASSDFLQAYIEAAYKQTKGEFKNLGQSIGFVVDGKFMSLTDFYTEQLDLAQMKVSTGVADYNTAIRQAVKQAASNGIQVMNYESGYRMSIGPASRMIVLTGVNQMAMQLNDGICDELGLDLVEVTAHAGARPSHQVWQGLIFSRSGKSKEYPDLVESTGLGDPGGLCGANCRHNYYGWFPGCSRAYTANELKNIDPPPTTYNGREYTYYEATQHMRYMERQMRKTKRELLAYEQAELDDDFTSASIKLRRQRDEYKKFAKSADISPRFERTEEIKYGRSTAAKAAWRVRKSNS